MDMATPAEYLAGCCSPFVPARGPSQADTTLTLKRTLLRDGGTPRIKRAGLGIRFAQK
jgi:hypothetical protein